MAVPHIAPEVDPSEVVEEGEASPPDRLARSMAVGLVAIGVVHFVSPEFFEKIVPRFLGHARFLVYLSGVFEIASGILIAVPRTRRTGALLAAATIVAVYPANWQMALDAGWPPRGAEGWGAWIRLPFQLPMVWVALKVAQRARS